VKRWIPLKIDFSQGAGGFLRVIQDRTLFA
jgi:hypothetical protein